MGKWHLKRLNFCFFFFHLCLICPVISRSLQEPLAQFSIFWKLSFQPYHYEAFQLLSMQRKGGVQSRFGSCTCYGQCSSCCTYCSHERTHSFGHIYRLGLGLGFGFGIYMRKVLCIVFPALMVSALMLWCQNIDKKWDHWLSWDTGWIVISKSPQ